VWSVEIKQTFRRKISPPSSGSKNKPRKKPASTSYQAELVYCLAYLSTLKMEAKFSSETSVDFEWTTLRYIPENVTLQNALQLHIQQQNSMMPLNQNLKS
jgi:hypothetical protein